MRRLFIIMALAGALLLGGCVRRAADNGPAGMAGPVIDTTETGRKYHSYSDAPWGTAPWDMGWAFVFEGAEMLVPLAEFTDSLEARGYKVTHDGGRFRILTGDYLGVYKDARIVAYAKGGKAYLVEVYPKATDSWEEAVRIYRDIRDYVSANGDETLPMDVDENLNISHVKEGPRYTDHIRREMRLGNVAYETVMTSPEGTLILGIGPDIANPMTRWAWKRGKFQVRLEIRNHVPEDTVIRESK